MKRVGAALVHALLFTLKIWLWAIPLTLVMGLLGVSTIPRIIVVLIAWTLIWWRFPMGIRIRDGKFMIDFWGYETFFDRQNGGNLWT